RIVLTPGLGVEVTVLDPVESKGKDRQQLCRELSARMSASLGVPDATAEKEMARQQRLRAASQNLQN
ncbi:MAG: 1-acyl-sn-glycerol-3-phosphate acyltransferase, partial [Sutterella sp.]